MTAPPVFLQDWARPLLVLHALLGLAGLGVSTHLAVVAVQLFRGRALDRLMRIYARLLGALYGLAFAVGLLIYPHYRVHVRGWYLDRYEPWASNLFDLKENLAALALPLGVGVMALGWRWDSARSGALRLPLLVLALLLWLTVATVVVSGLVVTDVRGV
jgi:TRAP-type C4-dicarboxylate transport system permease small subunit